MRQGLCAFLVIVASSMFMIMVWLECYYKWAISVEKFFFVLSTNLCISDHEKENNGIKLNAVKIFTERWIYFKCRFCLRSLTSKTFVKYMD